jgi:hypothetical protein
MHSFWPTSGQQSSISLPFEGHTPDGEQLHLLYLLSLLLAALVLGCRTPIRVFTDFVFISSSSMYKYQVT